MERQYFPRASTAGGPQRTSSSSLFSWVAGAAEAWQILESAVGWKPGATLMRKWLQTDGWLAGGVGGVVAAPLLIGWLRWLGPLLLP